MSVTLLIGAGAILAWQLHGQTSSGTSTATGTGTGPRTARVTRPRVRRTTRVTLVERRLGALSAPVQDAAVAGLDRGRALLLDGLTASDTSTGAIVLTAGASSRPLGQLPAAVHDTAAVRVGRDVYVFGGGTGVGQLDSIVRVDLPPAQERSPVTYPPPSSDQAAAVVNGTAYVIGGYTGSQWLDTIVAWRSGAAARVVAHLPSPVRYAAVTAVDGEVVIAGGSLPDGSASSAVLAFRPTTGRVIQLGHLPAPTTHGAAATLGNVAYLVGGRGTNTNTSTTRIVAIDPAHHKMRLAGHLGAPRSDLAAVGLGDRILLAGGRGAAGTEAELSELTRVTTSVTAAPHRVVRAVSHSNVYANDGANMLTGAARHARPLIYVPNSQSATVDVIDPRTYSVVEHFDVGALPQHVVPAWNLKTLYVTNDLGNSLTPIDPRTGKPATPIPVDDPYNMYFTPDGHYAIVVAERLHRLDFRDAHTFALHKSLAVPCQGVDHIDFSADGSYLIASCEFSGQMIKVDVKRERVIGVLDLPEGGTMPQDVKLSRDGRFFYVADIASRRDLGDRRRAAEGGGLPAHGRWRARPLPEPERALPQVTNRSEGSISVISFATRRQVAKWWIPGGGSPDMGGVSADTKVLWLSGRYNAVVYAISTRTGKLLARIPVGRGPHGLCVWPQPGRYSLGHTGILR